MSLRASENRLVWLIIGLVAGCCLSYFWPHEPVLADATDRTDKILITTAPVTPDNDAVFVLDFLTGQLKGAALSQQGAFVSFYYRNLAEDFKVDPTAKPNYVIVSGNASLRSQGAVQWGQSALFIAELTSGQVLCYGIPYKITQRPLPPVELLPVDRFTFREQ